MFFELEDIKRRHSMYSDIYNVGGWVPTPDANFSWMYQRGAIIGVTAALTNEFIHTFQVNWKLLSKHYETPKNLKEISTFSKSVLNMDQFKLMLRSRSQYALALGLVDIPARVTAFRYFNNGWQKPFGSFEFLFMRKIPTCFLAALITAPVSVPFELARMAYYADKTYPKELQKGYKSYFNALRRIPFEEGPYFLFKNSAPIYVKNFLQTMTLFYCFDFIKDKSSWMWRVGEVPYLPCKIVNAAFTSYLACAFTYPFAVTAREMIELWPKDKGGVCTWNGNYRKAMSWLWCTYFYLDHEFSTNYFPGFFKNYFYSQFPWMFITLMTADSLGIFSYWQVDMYSGAGTNSSEDNFS